MLGERQLYPPLPATEGVGWLPYAIGTRLRICVVRTTCGREVLDAKGGSLIREIGRVSSLCLRKRVPIDRVDAGRVGFPTGLL